MASFDTVALPALQGLDRFASGLARGFQERSAVEQARRERLRQETRAEAVRNAEVARAHRGELGKVIDTEIEALLGRPGVGTATTRRAGGQSLDVRKMMFGEEELTGAKGRVLAGEIAAFRAANPQLAGMPDFAVADKVRLTKEQEDLRARQLLAKDMGLGVDDATGMAFPQQAVYAEETLPDRLKARTGLLRQQSFQEMARARARARGIPKRYVDEAFAGLDPEELAVAMATGGGAAPTAGPVSATGPGPVAPAAAMAGASARDLPPFQGLPETLPAPVSPAAAPTVSKAEVAKSGQPWVPVDPAKPVTFTPEMRGGVDMLLSRIPSGNAAMLTAAKRAAPQVYATVYNTKMRELLDSGESAAVADIQASEEALARMQQLLREILNHPQLRKPAR